MVGHIFCDCPDCVKRDMIVVRLKEEIKIIKNEWYGEYGGRSSDLQILQKILGKE